MTAVFPDRNQAEKLFEWIVSERNKSPYPFRGDMEKTFRAHCLSVASISETIAAKSNILDSNQAYIMGLLHDCGRIKDEYALHEYHGVVGFNLMNGLGYPKQARICITHSFVDKKIDLDFMPHPCKDMLFCQKYLDTIEYDDYDYLMQLADNMNNLGQSCTIEQRRKSVSERYHVPYEKFSDEIILLNGIKNHFSKLCGGDIYQLLGIKE